MISNNASSDICGVSLLLFVVVLFFSRCRCPSLSPSLSPSHDRSATSLRFFVLNFPPTFCSLSRSLPLLLLSNTISVAVSFFSSCPTQSQSPSHSSPPVQHNLSRRLILLLLSNTISVAVSFFSICLSSLSRRLSHLLSHAHSLSCYLLFYFCPTQSPSPSFFNNV